jgi:hypothetical protein
MESRSMETTPVLIAAGILLVLQLTPGCGGGGGGSSRQLVSIGASATGMTQIQLTATGTFTSSPKTVSPLPVSWWVKEGVVLDPPYPYTLSSQPYSVGCQTGASVVAIAPANPSAASSGTIPTPVFQDLINAKTPTSDGGFVVSAPQMISCP